MLLLLKSVQCHNYAAFIKKTDIFDSLFTLSGVPFIYWCDCIVALLEAYGVNRGRLNVSCCFSLHLIKPTRLWRLDCGCSLYLPTELSAHLVSNKP